MNRARLREELIRDEGIRLEAYKDSVGLWTIGVGHLLGTERRMEKITKAEAVALLEADIDEAIRIAKKFAPGLVDVYVDGHHEVFDDVRARVIVNMAFNLGPRIEQFKNTKKLIETGQYAAAADNMLLSKWAGQVGVRATRLSQMMRTGEDV